MPRFAAGRILSNPSSPRTCRITVNLDAREAEELREAASREGLSLGTALRLAARSVLGTQAVLRPQLAPLDEAYDHTLQQELLLLILIAVEQNIKLAEAMNPYASSTADNLLSEATQAAQRRIARGVSEKPQTG
jgi:hypothetical protein